VLRLFDSAIFFVTGDCGMQDRGDNLSRIPLAKVNSWFVKYLLVKMGGY